MLSAWRAGSDAIVVCRPLSSFPLIVCHPISSAVVVCHCHCPPSPLSSSAIAVVVVRHRCCRLLPSPLSSSAFTVAIAHHHCHPLPPSSASAAIIATLCLRRLLPSALVCPLHNLPPNLACHCCLPLLLSAFAIIVCHRHLPLPQPSSPHCCLRRLSPPALVLPHCSLPPNHACCRRPPPSSSAVVIPPLVHVDCCIVSHTGPPQQVICDGNWTFGNELTEWTPQLPSTAFSGLICWNSEKEKTKTKKMMDRNEN
jgi:hypothetical protein